MVAGDKNTSKSTFILFLINSLIQEQRRKGLKGKIFLLDCDLGQQMFFVPGTVSLFEINEENRVLTNLSLNSTIQPIISYFLGEFTP